MKIAVTGAGGFIGSELLAVLNNIADVEVIGLTRGAALNPGADDCSGGYSGMFEWRSTDYSFDSLVKALDGADEVIHLAGVRGTENDPEKFAVNVEMTENILKAMAECGAKRIVFASTMSVYNDDSLMPWTEDAPLKGRSCYGDSKADCEELIRRYAGDTGVTYGIARIAQVVGEGEKRRGMMNVFIDTARDHGTIKVMGKSVLRKQYIYVKDLVNVLTILALGNGHCDTGNGNAGIRQDANITVNVGMQDAYSNLEVAQIVNEVFGNPTPMEYDDTYPEKGRPFHMDTGRLRNGLGYEPLDMKSAIAALRGKA